MNCGKDYSSQTSDSSINNCYDNKFSARTQVEQNPARSNGRDGREINAKVDRQVSMTTNVACQS